MRFCHLLLCGSPSRRFRFLGLCRLAPLLLTGIEVMLAVARIRSLVVLVIGDGGGAALEDGPRRWLRRLIVRGLFLYHGLRLVHIVRQAISGNIYRHSHDPLSAVMTGLRCDHAPLTNSNPVGESQLVSVVKCRRSDARRNSV